MDSVYLVYLRFSDTMGAGTLISAHWTERLAEAALKAAAEKSVRETSDSWTPELVEAEPVAKQGDSSKYNWQVVGTTREGKRVVLMTYYAFEVKVEGSAVDRLAELST